MSEISELNTQRRTTSSNLTKKQNQLKADIILKEQYENFKEAIDTAKRKTKSAMIIMETVITDYTSAYSSEVATENGNTLVEYKAEMETVRLGLEEIADDATTKISDLEAEIADLEKDVASLESDLKEIINEINSYYS